MPNYPYTFQLPPLNVQDIPNDGVAGEFLGINGSGQLDWLTAGGGGTGDMLKADNLSGLASYPTARTNLGLGTGDSPTFANLTLTSPSLSSSAPVTISQTWAGTGSTVFTALKVNATTPGTTSSSSSLLLDLQVGTVSLFKVSKTGSITANNTFNLSGSIVQSSGNIIPSNALIFDYFNQDVVLQRDAANTLALRNGAAAQTFRVYNTYSNAGVDVEYLQLSTSASGFRVGTNSSGSGSSRPLFLGVGGGSQWQINTSGHIGTFGSDNLYDIGASGANRPRNLYVGSNIYAAENVGIGTTAPSQKLEVWGNSGATISKVTSVSPGTASVLWLDGPAGQLVTSTGNLFLTNQSGNGIIFETASIEKMRLLSNGNLGIGTTSPTSKLHVAGNSSPSITVDNTLATGASQLLFKNTVVTGDTDGIFLNGSAQAGFGGNGSLNIKATTGPIAFHTASVTNALSIAQSGAVSCPGSFSASGSISAGNTLSLGGFTVILKDLGSAKLQILNSAQNVGCTLDAATDGYAKFRLRNSSTVFASVQGKLTTDTDYTATVVTPTGFLTLYDAQGNAYKVPCVAA